MIAALEFEDLVAPGVRARRPHRVEVGFRPAGDEAHLLCAGHRLDDRLGQLDALPVVGEEGGALLDLLLHRRGHLGMRVADQHRPGAEQEIDVFLAVLVPHPAGLALADHHLGGVIAEGAAGQYPPRDLDHRALDIRLCLRIHDAVSRYHRLHVSQIVSAN